MLPPDSDAPRRPELNAASSAALDAVLDAASDVLVNDGFDAVTFRRVASQSGLDQAAVHKLFDSTEQLLVAMLNREYSGMFRVIVDNIERDPLGGLMSRIYRYVFHAVYERPLARTLYLMDRDGLNRIMRATHGFAYIPQLGIRADFIDQMKDAGVVRLDADSAAVSAVVSAVAAGTALTAPHIELDDIIEGLCLLLESGVDADVADSTAGKKVFLDYAASLADGAGKEPV